MIMDNKEKQWYVGITVGNVFILFALYITFLSNPKTNEYWK